MPVNERLQRIAGGKPVETGRPQAPSTMTGPSESVAPAEKERMREILQAAIEEERLQLHKYEERDRLVGVPRLKALFRQLASEERTHEEKLRHRLAELG